MITLLKSKPVKYRPVKVDLHGIEFLPHLQKRKYLLSRGGFKSSRVLRHLDMSLNKFSIVWQNKKKTYLHLPEDTILQELRKGNKFLTKIKDKELNLIGEIIWLGKRIFPPFKESQIRKISEECGVRLKKEEISLILSELFRIDEPAFLILQLAKCQFGYEGFRVANSYAQVFRVL